MRPPPTRTGPTVAVGAAHSSEPLMTEVEAAAADRVFADAKRYEQRLSRLLIAFISSGLAFLIGPGSFLGLWNLFAISHQETAAAVPLAWLQAHGHAEVYGWVGSFILGIGFHSLARIRQARINLSWAWSCWVVWTAGVAIAWWAGVYQWHWRIWLPLGCGLELAGFLIFQITIMRAHAKHRDAAASGDEPKASPPGWTKLVFTGALGLLLTLILNFGGAVMVALRLPQPVLPMDFDWEMVDLLVWAFAVPFVLGFSTRWFPIFGGFRPAPEWMPRVLVPLIALGAVTTMFGWVGPSAALWLSVAVVAVIGLHVFEKPVQPAKAQGIHPSFPVFLRFAYGWLLIAGLLGLWAALGPMTAIIGLSGASRHALTVGFIAGMILTIGPRILPAFSGMKKLYSPNLMLLTLALLEIGCTLRVSGELLAYPGWLSLAWAWLPFSAAVEITAFVIFAYNILRTLLQPPAHIQRWRREAQASAETLK